MKHCLLCWSYYFSSGGLQIIINSKSIHLKIVSLSAVPRIASVHFSKFGTFSLEGKPASQLSVALFLGAI